MNIRSKAVCAAALLFLSIGSSAQDLARGGTRAKRRVAPLFEEHLVFVSGSQGYTTFRVPAAITAPNGDLLVFAEGRFDPYYIDRGNKDIVMARSDDRGRTWGEVQVVVDHRDYFAQYAGERVAVGNMAPVVDRDTGTIWLHFIIDGSYDPAATDHNISQWVTYSVDNGASWIDPIAMPNDVQPPEWDEWFHASGHGIQLEDGRLLVPGYHTLRDHPPDQPYPYSHVLYSDDHGEEWHVGDSVAYDTNEAAAVQLVTGNVLLNMRSVQHPERSIALSEDDGETWGPIHLDPQLTGAVCHAGLIRFTDERRLDRNRLLFSNPLRFTTDRENLSLKVSYDEGATWSAGKTIYPGLAAYSDLVILDDLTIGVFYDRALYSEMAFARLNIEWLTDGADTVWRSSRFRRKSF